MSHVVLQNVCKAFGPVTAVDHFNLTVEPGEFVALLGPSGCGKTTTLRIVAGFERPDQGEVIIAGVVATRRPPYKRDIGIVFQSYALFPHMTVFDNVAYGLRMRKVAGAEAAGRVQAALDLVHLEGLDGRYPRQLSGGQQQRVAVARAVVIRPSVLLFDEPLSNLDARLRQEMRRELRQLQRTLRIATIFVTHDQEEALSMADRVVVMNAGRIEQVGTPEEIYQSPRSAFVAGFIGECNFLAGAIVEATANHAIFAARPGPRFQLPPRPEFAAGRPGTVAIRPEDLVILTDTEAAPAGVNLAAGVLESVTYLGAVRHFVVTLDAGPRILIYGPGSRARSPRRLHDGERVRVAWLPEAGVFQPDPPRESGR
jgi:putative spermidine/putrescine transport system ATP-binding protein